MKYFTGDLSNWVNFCVKFAMKYSYGIEFGIFTGQKSIQDIVDSFEERARQSRKQRNVLAYRQHRARVIKPE